MRDAAVALAGVLRERATRSPTLVGIAGAVAAGKSTLAEALRDALAPLTVEVVTTDGFLLPNTVLESRGLLAHKGFPETYDVEHLATFLTAVRERMPVAAPVYSHEVYDVLAGASQVVDRPDVLIVEGVNVLSAVAELVDFRVYVDADEQDLETWYVGRFLALTDEARDDPTSFYAGFAGMSVDQVTAVAHQVWCNINLVNLREHIAPSRAVADCVVSLGADHSVRELRLSPDSAPPGDKAGEKAAEKEV